MIKVFFGTTQAAVPAADEESKTLPVYIQDEFLDVFHETTRRDSAPKGSGVTPAPSAPCAPCA